LPEPFNSSAELAARGAVYSRTQDKYWPLREKLLAPDVALSPSALAKMAADVGLDPAKLAANSSTGETDDALKKARADARAAGIDSAPAFVLGRETDEIVTGIKMAGAQTFERMAAEVHKLLPAAAVK
jgi:predicted DsbA family dithiol-disulfide isomerase